MYMTVRTSEYTKNLTQTAQCQKQGAAAIWATARKDAFLPCGHLDFESAVTAQNDEFKVSFGSLFSCWLNVKT